MGMENKIFFSACLLFFFCANYCVIVTTNFSPCCGWLRFAAQPGLLIFTLGIQTQKRESVALTIGALFFGMAYQMKSKLSHLSHPLKPPYSSFNLIGKHRKIH